MFALALLFLFFSLSEVECFHVKIIQQRSSRTTLRCQNMNSKEGTSTNYHARGLLTGISDVNEAKFYSDKLVIKDSYKLLEDKKNIYNLCLANADGNTTNLDGMLKVMFENARLFVKSSEIWDREELLTALKFNINDEGSFVCLLGGKSTGKSLVLTRLENVTDAKVLKVDLRKTSNILIGLVTALHDRQRRGIDQKLMNLFASVFVDFASYYMKMSTKVLKEEFLKDEFDLTAYKKILMQEQDPAALPNLIDKLVGKLGAITLVIDEANLALTISESTSPANVEATKEALALFTALTKQERKLNVILVSSEHAFPYRLQDPRLSFNILDFNKIIYAGEVPPGDMYKLLTTRWGVKHNLAVALIDLYGGHVYDVYEVLKQLYFEKESAYLLDARLSNNVRNCLNWEGGAVEDTNRMRDALRYLATTGFFPFKDPKDPLAKVISENNVGGVVLISHKVIGLHPDVWGTTECDNGIIASKQSMRMAIAKVLKE